MRWPKVKFCELSNLISRNISNQLLASSKPQIDDSKNFNEDGYKTFLNEAAIEDYEKAIATDVATKCTEKMKNVTKENESGCKPTALGAMMCAGKEFFNACPAESQNKSEECEKMRQMINGIGHHRGGPGGAGAPEGPEEPSE